ncbi:MAG: acyl-CoA dehydrogenase family protein [Candidatus Thiodiazotropha endolucinida]
MQQRKMTFDTHKVLNQPPPLEKYNAYRSDAILQHYIKSFGGEWGEERLEAYGQLVGYELQEAGFDANAYKPEFHSHDRFGHRVDFIKYHPAYHRLMAAAIDAGHHNLPWVVLKTGAHVVRAGIEYLHTQADPGSGCPLTMTFSSILTIRHQPDIAQAWIPKITAALYDPRNLPYYEKQGLTIGMAMTEKQGGSDVRANTTRASPIDAPGPGESYELVGHKWFCSAPMSDAFLTLANTDSGLSCFLLPRWRPDGTKNAIHIQRLKNKMGNVSNASAEIEYGGAFAWMIGEEGRGVRTILEMVAMTRFDCMVGSSAIMGHAAAQALHHTGARTAFGRNLQDHPLMQNVLADLAIEAEASLAISMRLAHALDKDSDDERLLFRIGTAIGKYWICKRAAQHTYEAMESVGGVAVVEDNVLARLYRESPINAIWEGSGNIQCLDVVRALEKNPNTLDIFLIELEKAKNHLDLYDEALGEFKQQLLMKSQNEYALRQFVETMALLWQAATLIQFSDATIAESFILSRLAHHHSYMYGTLPEHIPFRTIIQRAKPKI